MKFHTCVRREQLSAAVAPWLKPSQACRNGVWKRTEAARPTGPDGNAPRRTCAASAAHSRAGFVAVCQRRVRMAARARRGRVLPALFTSAAFSRPDRHACA